jgi:hypothetical protein
MMPLLMMNSAKVALETVRSLLFPKTSPKADKDGGEALTSLLDSSLMFDGMTNKTRARDTRAAESRKLALNEKAEAMYPLKVEPTTVPTNSIPWNIPMAPPRRSASKRFRTNIIATACAPSAGSSIW